MDQRSAAAEHFVQRAREIIAQPAVVAGHNGGIFIPDQEEFVRWCLGGPTPVEAPAAPLAEVIAQAPAVALPSQPEGPPAWLGQVMNPILDRIEAIEQRIMTPPAYVPPVIPTYQERLQRAPLSPFVSPFLRTPGLR